MSQRQSLPARRVDAAGREHIDVRAIFALALPMVANSAVQLILSLTDVWFVGHISTTALAAVGAMHWLALVVVVILSGIGQAVQPLAAQAFGARRRAHASRSVWIALWGVLLVTPLFFAAGMSGHPLMVLFGLPDPIQKLAVEFWLPRVAGAPLGAAAWAVMGFFNGIGRPRVTLIVMAVMAFGNALLNALFIFHLGLGVAGAAYATTVAQALGLLVAMVVFLNRHQRTHYRSHLTWRPRARRIGAQLRLGFPMGLMAAADLLGMSLFQVMQVRLSAVEGAASQIVMVLTSVAYMPGFGIALAGTTLVGQSIGAGDRRWAYRLGNRVVALAALYMGGAGLLLALAGPWLLPLFAGAHDAASAQVIALGSQLLWIAAAYQFFDGLNMGAGFCLRGAGDATVPALLVLLLSWLFFLPLAHSLSFAPGQGWFDLLPQFALGAPGGWAAVVIYIMVLGLVLLARWRSRVWERLHLEA
jgi:MATE family multidrug resistance protein